jgi:hypothetical protein
VPQYLDAASRHHADGSHLLGLSRHESADQLAGYATECAIKAILCGPGGVQIPNIGAPAHGTTKFSHLPNLWNNATMYLSGRTAASGKPHPSTSLAAKSFLYLVD